MIADLMTLRRWTPRLLAAMSLWIISSGCAVARPAGDWHTDYESAMAEAKRTGKPIIADFSASWCGACKQMERTTFRDPNVNQRLDNYVKLYVDFDENPDLAKRFNVEALPTVVAMSPKGQVMERNVGYMSSAQMSGVLDNVIASIPKPERKVEKPAKAELASSESDNPRSSERKVSANDERVTKPEANARTTARNSSDSPASGIRLAQNRSAETRPDEARTASRDTSPREISLYNLPEATTARTQRIVAQADAPRPDGQTARSRTTVDSISRSLSEEGGSPPRQPMGGGVDNGRSADDNEVSANNETPQTRSANSSQNSAAARLLRQPPTIDGASNNANMVLRAQRDLEPRPSILAQSTSDDTGMPRPMIDAGATRDASATPAPRAPRTNSGSTSNATSGSGASAPSGSAPARATNSTSSAPAATPRPATATGTRGASASTSGMPDSLKRLQRAKAAQPIAPARVAENAGSSTAEPPPAQENSAPASGATASAAPSVTADDIERWLKDGDGKLTKKQTREARAMYAKIVEADPSNQFGRSDLAFIKMVSSMVDKDDDSVRRQAFSKIKEFPAKFPNSEHRDYYTLVRSTLAVDLGDKADARRLLENYPDEFPNSRYIPAARVIWDEVKPGAAAASSSRPAASNATSASNRSSGSSSSSTRSSGSTSSSGGLRNPGSGSSQSGSGNRSTGGSTTRTPRSTPRSSSN